MTKTQRFFYRHTDWSKSPARHENPHTHVKHLARAELWALEQGYRYEWGTDPDADSSDFSDGQGPYALYTCLLISPNGNIVDSLHTLDFGPDGLRASDPQQRVIEADLALTRVKTLITELLDKRDLFIAKAKTSDPIPFDSIMKHEDNTIELYELNTILDRHYSARSD